MDENEVYKRVVVVVVKAYCLMSSSHQLSILLSWRGVVVLPCLTFLTFFPPLPFYFFPLLPSSLSSLHAPPLSPET